MKRILVHFRDKNRPPAISEWMANEAAEAEKTRIEQEHARAGGKGVWIQVGRQASVQAEDVLYIELQERDDEPDRDSDEGWVEV